MRELFELFGIFHFEDFSDTCNDTGIYIYILIFIISISFLFNLVYYIIIDSSIYNQNRFYFGWCLISSITCGLICFGFTQYRISIEGLQFDKTGYLSLAFISIIYSFLFYFLESLLLKTFSKNSYRTPF